MPMTTNGRLEAEMDARERGRRWDRQRRGPWYRKQWFRGVVVAVVLAVGLALAAAACTPEQVTYYRLAKQCQAIGNSSGFCRCAFGPGAWGPDRCWGR